MIAALMLPLVMGLDISLGGAEDDRRFGYAALVLFALTAAGSVRWRRDPGAMAMVCAFLASLYAFLAGFALAMSAIEFSLPVLVIMVILLGSLAAAGVMFSERSKIP
jgi:hypothetical protein